MVNGFEAAMEKDGTLLLVTCNTQIICVRTQPAVTMTMATQKSFGAAVWIF